MTEMPKPTAQVEVYVKVLGSDQAIDFLLTFGGAELDFPKSPSAASQLVECVGQQKAEALCAALDHTRRRIPTAKPWLAAALKSKGLSQAEIARKLHTTDVTVRKWLNTARQQWRQNPAQLPLFPEDG
jgi:DNA-binding transcriptional regulator YiaG